MYQSILHIFQVILTTTRPEVAILIKIALQISVYTCGHRVAPNVEFSLLVEQGTLTVLLDDVAAFFAVYMRIANDLLDLAQFSADSDATASIRVLAWLHNPQLFTHAGVLGQVLVLEWFRIGFHESVKL
jgi:hypothetical protein